MTMEEHTKRMMREMATTWAEQLDREIMGTSYTSDEPEEEELTLEKLAETYQLLKSLQTKIFLIMTESCPDWTEDEEGKTGPACYLMKPEVTYLDYALVIIHPRNKIWLHVNCPHVDFVEPTKSDWQKAQVKRVVEFKW